MPRFAANLSFMYNEHAFFDRFAAAAADSFHGVEFLFPYEYSAQAIRERLDASGLTLALFNAPPGDAPGDRGIASIPGREAEFAASIDRALDYAHVLGNKRLHVMAGLIGVDQDRARHRDTYVENLALAARKAVPLGLTVLIEPLNPYDMPGYFISRQDEAHAVVADVGASNLRVQMDFYHCQLVEGDLANKLRKYVTDVGHIQIAGVPGRHEPSIGEINYPYLFQLMDELDYAGWVGCEYRPRAATSAGLEWLRKIETVRADSH